MYAAPSCRDFSFRPPDGSIEVGGWDGKPGPVQPPVTRGREQETEAVRGFLAGAGELELVSVWEQPWAGRHSWAGEGRHYCPVRARPTQPRAGEELFLIDPRHIT